MAGDIYFSTRSLLLHGIGTNGSTTVTDSSITPKTVTAVGNAAISTAQYKWATSSIYFDGNGDYLTADNQGIGLFRTGDLTIEMWCYITSYGTNFSGYGGTLFDTMVSDSGAGIFFHMTNTGYLRLQDNSSVFATGTNLLPLNSWVHIALTRQNGVMKTWIGGALDINVSHSTDYTTTNITIGAEALRRSANTDMKYNGYMSDIRVTIGRAEYTSAFTPPTATFADYIGQLTGTVNESLGIDAWDVYAVKCKDKALAGSTTTSGAGATYTINCNTAEPCIVTATPKIDGKWKPSTYFPVGFYMCSATPDSHQHIWKCTAVAGELLYNNRVLLLHFNGTNGSTSFPDTSSPTKTTAIYSGTPAITTTYSMFGGSCLDVSGTSGAKDIVVTNTAAFLTGTGDFTIQGRFMPTASGSGRIAIHKGVNANGGYAVGCSTTEVYFRRNGTTDLAVAATVSSTSFSHIAWVNHGGVQTIYLNGVAIGSATLAININDTSDIHIGSTAAWFSDSNRFYGYIDEVSISNTAEYTANFTPPSAAFMDTAGASGTSEPTLALSGDTVDGTTTTWTYVAPLVNPISYSPRIPS